MAITEQPPRELVAVAYTQTGTSTTTTGHGAALSNAWGGSFTIGSRTTVDIEVWAPFVSLAATSGVFSEIHVLVDSTCVAEGFLLALVNGLGGPISRKVRVTGLAAGAHTIAVQGKVGGSTLSVVGTSTNPGLLTVCEV